MKRKLILVYYNFKKNPGIKKEKDYLPNMNLMISASLMQFSTLLKSLRRIFLAQAGTFKTWKIILAASSTGD